MSGLTYKGYTGSVEFSEKDEVFHGKLIGIRDLVTYEATDAPGLKASFREAVEDYLVTCKKHGRQPDVPFKGSFNVRVGRDLHKRAAIYASERGKKLNVLVGEALAHYLDREEHGQAAGGH
jgi:predicted HicB family RNase H-like nuclease